MNWKKLFWGASIGFLSGLIVKSLVDKQTTVSPEKVLNDIKKMLSAKGSISGSWILMQTEPYTKSEINYNVYRGGISRNIDGKLQQIEFIADASTGTIIDIYPIDLA